MKGVLLVVLFFFVSIIISLFNPLGGVLVSDEIRMVFSFTSFLFGILSGFFIASLWDRFTKIRTLISKESAFLEDIYKFFELADKDVAKRIAEKIDRYIIKAQEYDLHLYQEKIGEEYSDIFEELGNLKQEGLSKTLTNRIIALTVEFTETRKEILSRGKDKLGIFHWTVLVFLAGLTIYIWLYIQFEGLFGIIIGTVLIFSIFAVITIIYDLNNLTWGTERMDVEIYEKVYDEMGMARYYPEECLDEVKIPKEIDEYRVGYLNPETGERDVEKVKNE